MHPHYTMYMQGNDEHRPLTPALSDIALTILLSLFFSSHNGRADKRYVIVNVYIYNNI